MATLHPEPIVDREELAEALEWVSAGALFENAAYIARETGRIFWVGEGVEQNEDFPDDIEDGSQYISVPHKQDLGLGKSLALRFAHEYMPSNVRKVHEFFAHPSAFRRFKQLLERQRLIDSWYSFESLAVESALEEWASENGFIVGNRPASNDA